MKRSITTWPRLRRWATTGALLAGGASIAGCSIEDAQPIPDCLEGDSTSIVAQSVPTAQLVPCFDPLPAGWDVENVRIDQEGTIIRFDSDRAGDDAAIFRYADTCELGQAVSAPSEHEGAERYEHIERIDPGFRAQRYYVFEGGCIWWQFDFDDEATAALSIELGDRLRIVTRDDFNDAIRDFIDEPL